MSRMLLIFLAFALCCAMVRADTIQQPVQIGAILPLTGDFAFVGRAIQAGAQMRLAEDTGTRLEDDHTYERKSIVSAFRKLTSVNNVPLVFLTVAPAMAPISSLIPQTKVPTIAVWDFNEGMHQPKDFKYSMGYSNEAAGEAMAELARHVLELPRVAVVTAHDEWSTLLAKTFMSRFEHLGGVAEEVAQVDLNDSDLGAIVLKAKQRNDPAIYFPLYLSSVSSLVRQCRQLGYSGALLTGEGLTEPEVKVLGALAEGVYFQRIWVSDPNFQTKYAKFSGETKQPADIGFVGLGYDMASLAIEVVDALAKSNHSITAPNIQELMQTKKFKGVTGEVDFQNFRGKRISTLQLVEGKIVPK
jgi:branched-chain amino acid transport system substrate-binding protein